VAVWEPWDIFEPLREVNIPALASALVALCGSSTDFDSNEQTATGSAPVDSGVGTSELLTEELEAAHRQNAEAERKLKDANAAKTKAETSKKAAEKDKKRLQRELDDIKLTKAPRASPTTSPAQLKVIKATAKHTRTPLFEEPRREPRRLRLS